MWRPALPGSPGLTALQGPSRGLPWGCLPLSLSFLKAFVFLGVYKVWGAAWPRAWTPLPVLVVPPWGPTSQAPVGSSRHGGGSLHPLPMGDLCVGSPLQRGVGALLNSRQGPFGVRGTRRVRDTAHPGGTQGTVLGQVSCGVRGPQRGEGGEQVGIARLCQTPVLWLQRPWAGAPAGPGSTSRGDGSARLSLRDTPAGWCAFSHSHRSASWPMAQR